MDGDRHIFASTKEVSSPRFFFKQVVLHIISYMIHQMKGIISEISKMNIFLPLGKTRGIVIIIITPLPVGIF